MQYTEWYEERDGHQSFCCSWLLEQPQAVVQLSHGMGEHIGRYQDFALFLNAQGFSVYGSDHRGHGKSCSPEHYGDMGDEGWQKTVADGTLLSELIKQRNPDLPLFLFAHSMGSMLAQQSLASHGQLYQGVILSGSPGFVPRFLAGLAKFIASFESWRLGDDGHSAILEKLVFADSNKAFDKDGASGFEWLSRDPVEVEKYLQDPACGFVLRAQSMREMFAASLLCSSDKFLKTISKFLPILLLSGAEDPVHDKLKNLGSMQQAYGANQLNVEQKIYPGGRHEMLNETNKQEAMADIGAWLQRQLNDK